MVRDPFAPVLSDYFGVTVPEVVDGALVPVFFTISGAWGSLPIVIVVELSEGGPAPTLFAAVTEKV